MGRAPEVLIVGAGVIGASVAWHLASRGCTDVRVIDRAPKPGAGSTLRATGGFRAQFGSDVNVRLSLLARTKLRHFRQEVGVDSGYRPTGYLFLASDDAQLDRLRRAQRIQHAAGLDEARMIDVAKAAALNAAVSLEDVVGAAFCPTDGFIDPNAMLHGYIDAATRLGVRFEFGTAFRPTMPAGTIVNAAGAWAAEVCDVPVRPVRRQVLPTKGPGLLTPDMPMTVFAKDAFHFRVRDGRVLLLWPGGAEPADPHDVRVDPSWMDAVEAFARARVPGLRGVGFDRAAAWGGLYEMSPDEHAIVGRVGSMVVVNGSSGHGVMHSPALGQLAAEIVLDGRATSLDVTALRPSRFSEKRPVDAVPVF